MDDKKNAFDSGASFADLANKYLSDSQAAEQAATVEQIPPVSPPAAPAQLSAPQKSEVYFSNQFNPVGSDSSLKRQGEITSVSPMAQWNTDSQTAKADQNPVPAVDPELDRYRQRRKNRRKYLKDAKKKLRLNFDASRFTKNTYIFFAVVISLSVIISVYAVFCVNDLFALMKKDNAVTVSVAANDIEDVDNVINLLHDNKLINCPTFCKIFVRLRSSMFVKTSKGPIEYTQGTFELNPKMGLEGLLVTLQGEVVEKEIVQVTFPEGFTVPQIIEKLVANGVCDEDALKAELAKATYTYSILNSMSDSETIAYKFEGYLFPDTYEFYQGENPNSVIEKFVKNLDERFTQEMRIRADELGMSIHEVLTLASIIQQEAANADQMKTVSGILHNRLNAPELLPTLDCNSTQDYIKNRVAGSLTAASPHTSDYYMNYYNTYIVRGLTPGAIANPGMDAIEAALYPEAAADLFYFCHDREGKMYTARNMDEQRANIARYNVNTSGN